MACWRGWLGASLVPCTWLAHFDGLLPQRIYTVLEDDVCTVVPAMDADAMPTAGICAVHALDGWCCVTTRDRELRIYAIQESEEPGKPPALQLAHCVSAAHELTPSAVALSPQAGRVASGARDASVALFDTSTGAEQCRGADSRALVTALAWASHSELVVAAEDLALRVWDCRSNSTFQVSGKSDSVQYFPKRVAVSNSGRYIASGARGVHADDGGSAAAQGGEVRIWDLRMPGKVLASVAASGAVGSDCVALAWSENDQQVRSLYASGYMVDCLLPPDYQGMTTSIKRSIPDHLQAPLHCAAAWPAVGPSPPRFVYAADDIATYSCLATTR